MSVHRICEFDPFWTDLIQKKSKNEMAIFILFKNVTTFYTGSPLLTRFSNNTFFLITQFILLLSFVHLVLNHSSAYTVFCLHGCFSKVSKNNVSRGLPLLGNFGTRQTSTDILAQTFWHLCLNVLVSKCRKNLVPNSLLAKMSWR